MQRCSQRQAPTASKTARAEASHCWIAPGVWALCAGHAQAKLSMPMQQLIGSAACADFDAQALLDREGKGKPLPAIIDQVISGSMLRVTLLPDRCSASATGPLSEGLGCTLSQ